MPQLQIWYCTRTGNYEIKPQSLTDRKELYEWSPTNISAFRDVDYEDKRVTYSSSTIDVDDGFPTWKYVPKECVPAELEALTLLAL